ncbi:MAG TPA: hypothetical protein VJT54_17495 [Verrucomicrobiae bacterium]|nr:hypothetical protein [Verrucomicrobiae bacterium]
MLIREGSDHSWWGNPSANRRSAVPRHTEINKFLARKICRPWEFLNHETRAENAEEWRQPIFFVQPACVNRMLSTLFCRP